MSGMHHLTTATAPRAGGPMGEELFDEAAPIAFRGPVPGVQVHAHMEFGPHALIHPLDTKVVIQLMFMFAEQNRQGGERLRVTPLTVLERLREVGVVSGNGTRLVGRDAVYESFARLREKGYIRRLEPRSENGQKVGTSYEFYDFPTFNPDAAPDSRDGEFPQVTPTSGNAGSGIAGSSVSQMGSNQQSPQVTPTSGIAGSGFPGSGNADVAFPQVTPTSGNAGSPPHPPEEVDTSSPYPLTGTLSELPSQREEEAGVRFAAEDLAAAAEVLQLLDKPWAVGRVKARELAPLLLSVMRDQGWPDILTVDRSLLSAELTKNPGGARSHVRLLKTDRIPDLVRYEVAARATAKPSPGGGRPGGQAMCERHPGFEEGDCSPCRIAERERAQRDRSEPAGIDGAGLLARFRANLPAG